MALPADIRAILEAAHIPWPEEPETGCTLRQVWERKAEARRQMPPRW